MLSRYNANWETLTVIQSHFKELRRRKEYEEQRDLPLHVIAKESGLSLNTIQRFSSDTLDRFDRESLIKLCKYFGVKSIGELIEYKPSE